MSEAKQTTKNIDLTQKLIQFLLKKGTDFSKLPKDTSFVPFSKKDKKLNKANEELLVLLSQEDKPVAKAQEPRTSAGTWIITPVNF